MGTPNREPQEYSSNIVGIHLLWSSYSYHVPTMKFGFSVWCLHSTPFVLTLPIPQILKCFSSWRYDMMMGIVQD